MTGPRAPAPRNCSWPPWPPSTPYSWSSRPALTSCCCRSSSTPPARSCSSCRGASRTGGCSPRPSWSSSSSPLLASSPGSPPWPPAPSPSRRGPMTDTTTPGPGYGVHSEVGQLRKVLVCAPGLAHNRLTPSNCDDLLFDDVLWVQNAQRDHFDFMTKMRERGVEVVELHNLLTEMLDIPQAKAWLLDRKITANEVGLGLVEDTRAFLGGLESRELA